MSESNAADTYQDLFDDRQRYIGREDRLSDRLQASHPSITQNTYMDTITFLKKTNMDAESHRLIDDVASTLSYYFSQGGEPLYEQTVWVMAEDYLDKKHGNPGFRPPDGTRYLSNQLASFDIKHKFLAQDHRRIALARLSNEYSKTKPRKKKSFREYTDKEVATVILNLNAPMHHILAGVQFLLLLLKHKGVTGVADFMDEAMVILDQEGKLLDYDFKGENEALAKHARIGKFSNRRTFFSTAAWGICGWICTINGVTQSAEWFFKHIINKALGDMAGDDLHAHDKKNKNTDDPHVLSWMEKQSHLLCELTETHFSPIENLIIGPALIYENIKESETIKYEQISNAVAELTDYIRKETRLNTPAREQRSNRYGRG